MLAAIFVEDAAPVPNPSRADPCAAVAAAKPHAFAQQLSRFLLGMPAGDGNALHRFHWEPSQWQITTTGILDMLTRILGEKIQIILAGNFCTVQKITPFLTAYFCTFPLSTAFLMRMAKPLSGTWTPTSAAQSLTKRYAGPPSVRPTFPLTAM